MLQQMLNDDKTEEVREAVVRSLGLLMGFIDDCDKYSKVYGPMMRTYHMSLWHVVAQMLITPLALYHAENFRQIASSSRLLIPMDVFSLCVQGTELLTDALGDLSGRVLAATQQVFLPSFAMWASEIGRLQSDLLQLFVDKMEKLALVVFHQNRQLLVINDRKGFVSAKQLCSKWTVPIFFFFFFIKTMSAQPGLSQTMI